MRATDFITEIEAIPSWMYSGGKSSLTHATKPKRRNLIPLPGGSRFAYAIIPDEKRELTELILVDPAVSSKKVIASLVLKDSVFPLKGKPLSVGTITVDEDYRGKGLAKALYGIVLSIMKRPLVAGDAQTPGGRKNWMSLSQIPGVEVKGILQMHKNALKVSGGYYGGGTSEKQVDNRIDQLMELGGQFVGKDKYNTYWAFDVVPGNGQLQPHVKNSLSKIYGYDAPTGLYAVWTGAGINEDMNRRGFLGALGTGAMAASGAAQAKINSSPKPVANNPKVELLMQWAKKFITDPAELAAFMAQCAHESDNFKAMEEYGSPERFAKKYDIQYNPAKAKQLGNDKPGDGIKYRGRGYIQLTGKYNYEKAGEWISKFINHPVDFVKNPDMVATPTAAALSSIWYWKTFVKPRTKSFSNTKQVTKNINPGLKGQSSREQKARDWQAHLNVKPGKPTKVASR